MTLEMGGWAAQQASWTDERTAALKRLVAAGLSASRIAAELGNVTRNAVIGKIHRMGAQLRGTQAQKAYAKPAVPVARVMKPQPAKLKIRPGHASGNTREVMRLEATEIIDLAPDTSEFACTIVDLTSDMCRWPLDGEPSADMRYCGAPSVGPWCPRHRAIVFTPLNRRRA